MNDIFHTQFQQFVASLQGNRNRQFWFLQLIGWVGLCVVTFLSLTLWYNAPEWAYVVHTIVQAALGMLATLPLRYIYRSNWRKPVITQIYTGIGVVIVGALLWTVLRMLAYQVIVTEDHLWNDFGGWYFGSFMVFASWSSFYYGIKYYQLLREEQQAAISARQLAQEEHVKRLTAEAHSREAQLKMLRYQLNPHFLFNSLNSVSALIKTDHNDQAREMISELSSFLRFSLVTDPALKVSLSRELEMLLQYLNIEKARYGDRLTLEFDIAEEAKKGLVPSLLLQPLYENALKHAIAILPEGGVIKLVCSLKNDRMLLRLTDSGPGLKLDEGAQPISIKPHGSDVGIDVGIDIEKGRGLGLRNTRERLHSQYGEDYQFDFLPHEPTGLTIVIDLPFEPAGVDQREHIPELVSHHES